MSALATRLSVCLFVPALLAACANTGYSYSELDGSRYHRTPIDTYPVQIVEVDGKSTPLTGPVLVEPGRHVVTVATAPSAVRRFGEERSTTLDVAPCTRYNLVAVKANALATDFKIAIDHQEPVAGCTAPPPR
jgi:hypothetical protein